MLSSEISNNVIDECCYSMYTYMKEYGCYDTFITILWMYQL